MEARCPACGREPAASSGGPCATCAKAGAGTQAANRPTGPATHGAAPLPVPPASPCPTPVEATRAYSQNRVPGDLPTRTSAPAEPGPAPGTAFGRYRLERTLGAGGMGVVWLAFDSELRRPVALKLMRESEWTSPDSGARFEREARLAARLRHSGIVRVHDVGMHEGRRYLTMDYVEGRTLGEVLQESWNADAAGAAGAADRLRRLVALLAETAEAVAHAHGEGVIHRDLKPSNVLVDREGRAVVMDFGLAKEVALEPGSEPAGPAPARMTLSGQILGTPTYMSPEQVAADGEAIGPCSDVWALGVMLYEVLARKDPFAAARTLDVFQAITREDPAPPRRFNRDSPADLEAVSLKALEKEPGRRYAGAGEFAEELRRWLRGEPVQARLPSVAARLWRVTVRWKMAVIPASVAALLGLTFGAYVLGTRRATDRLVERWTQEGARHEAAGRRQEALQAYERAYGLAPDDVVLASFRDAAAARLAEDRERLAREKRLAEERKSAAEVYHLAARQLELFRLRSYRRDWRLDDREIADYERLVDTCRAEMSRTGEIAQAWWVVGRVRHVLGDPSAALEAYEAGLALDARHGACLLHKAKAWIERAVFERLTSLRDRDRAASAEKRMAAALELVEAAIGEGAGSEFELDLARGYQLVVQHKDARDYCEAMLMKWSGQDFAEEFLLIRGLARGEGLIEAATAALERRPAFAEAFFFRGIAQVDARRFAEARADYDRALEINPRYAEGFLVRGDLRGYLGDPEGALADFGRALEINPKFAEALHRRGVVRFGLKRSGEAAEDFRAAILLRPGFLDARLNLAASLFQAGDLEGALREYNELIAEGGETARVFVDRASVRSRRGDDAGAIRDCDEAIRVEPRYARAWSVRGHTRERRGDLRGALEDFDRALELDPRDAEAAINRGGLRGRFGDWRGALEDAERAIQLDPRRPEGFHNRAVAREATGDLAGALEDCERAVALGPELAIVWVTRAAMREKKGDVAGAGADYDEAVKRDPGYANGWYNRARFRHIQGDLRGALEDYGKAIEAGTRSPEPYASRGVVRLKLGDPAGAAEDFDRALTLDSRHVLSYKNRAWLRVRTGDLAGARADADKAVELAPESSESWTLRGAVRRVQGDPAGSREDLDRAIGLDGKNAQAWSHRGLARYDLGDLAGAAEDLEQALARAPDDLIALGNRAMVRIDAGDAKGALADLDRVLAGKPDDRDARFRRALLRSAAGDHEGALVDADRALALQPEDPDGLHLRGTVRAAAGDLNGALQEFDAALKRRPEFPDALVHRGQNFAALADEDPARARERLQAAVADIARALELAPADWSYRKAVSGLLAELRERAKAAGGK